ncbi:MAG: phosphocholine cytidylyltransferase family protein [Deltaproteobacteria bacterium]|nr:phosphocholine cytidylyltransferase family protein [Deltaproteobacteria bacterium]
MSTSTAVLLVAGVGSRLRARSGDLPKCLVEVAGRTILDRAVGALVAHGVRRIVLATGHREDLIRAALRHAPVPVAFCPNPRYASTQNSVSLALCRQAVGGEAFFKLDGDLVFDPAVLARLDECPAPLAVAVHRGAGIDEEAMKVRVDVAGRIVDFGKRIALADAGGESIGIERISSGAAPPIFEALAKAGEDGRHDLYYEDVYATLVAGDLEASAVDVSDLRWAEIDNPDDLDRASAEWYGR